MRRKNWRVVLTGLALMVIAAAFFLGMSMTMPSGPSDPVAMMQTVGQVAGPAGGLGLVMIIFGLIGKKPQSQTR